MKRDPLVEEDVFDYVETLNKNDRLQMYKNGFNHNEKSQVSQTKWNIYKCTLGRLNEPFSLKPIFPSSVAICHNELEISKVFFQIQRGTKEGSWVGLENIAKLTHGMKTLKD